jgi:hypothetical protein
VVVPRTLAQTPVLLSLGGKTTGFSVLVDWVGDPVDTCVSADGLVVGAGISMSRYIRGSRQE